MASVDEINGAIALGQEYYLELLASDTTNRQYGLPAVNTKKLTCLRRLIKALGWDLDISVNDSVTTVLYELLLDGIGNYYGAGLVVDPSVIIPGTPITVVTGAGSVKRFAIPFTNQTAVVLNWQSDYSVTYGPNPVSFQIYVSDGSGGFYTDLGTAPDLVYTVAGDPTSGLVSATWGYALPTSGYYELIVKQ